MLEHSQAPVKMMQEDALPGSSDLTLCTQTPIYIYNPKQYSGSSSNTFQCQSNKNAWQRCDLDNVFLNVTGLRLSDTSFYLFISSQHLAVVPVGTEVRFPPVGDFQRICLWALFIISTLKSTVYVIQGAVLDLSLEIKAAHIMSPSCFEGLTHCRAVELSSGYITSFCSTPAPEKHVAFFMWTQLTLTVF